MSETTDTPREEGMIEKIFREEKKSGELIEKTKRDLMRLEEEERRENQRTVREKEEELRQGDRDHGEALDREMAAFSEERRKRFREDREAEIASGKGRLKVLYDKILHEILYPKLR